MESIPTLEDSKTLRGADSNPGPHLSEQSIPTAERVPMGNEEEVNEASPLVELCKAPPRIQRSTSITSPGYYDWRRRLWSEVTTHLKQKRIPDLMTFYDRHYERWKSSENNHIDIALITLSRKGVTALFNMGLVKALKVMKGGLRELEKIELSGVSIPNAHFARASMWSVIAMIYTKKNKLGKAWYYITRANDALQNTEKCEFHADCAYVTAEIYLIRAAIGGIKDQSLARRLKVKALTSAKLSRDICTVEKDRGEWFALYAVESLFLYLRIYLEADHFGLRSTLTLEEFQTRDIWSKEEIQHMEQTMKQVKTECDKLHIDYPYIQLGLAKCTCILMLHKARTLQKVNDLRLAKGLCKVVLQILGGVHAKCAAFSGGVMAKFVEMTKLQLGIMMRITHEYERSLDILIEQENKDVFKEMTHLTPEDMTSDAISSLGDLDDSWDSVESGLDLY